MFKSSEIEVKAVPVQISAVTGKTLRGHIQMVASSKLIDFLNRENAFFEFIGADGQSIILSKATVQSIDLIEVPRTDQLSRRMKLQDTLDPYTILGVVHGATGDEVKSAYRERARQYHPDNFAGTHVPAEIIEYVTAMFMRVTDAYRQLCPSAELDRAA